MTFMTPATVGRRVWSATVLLVLAVSVFAVFECAKAQPSSSTRIVHIGFLSSGFPAATPGPLLPFIDGLRARGWVEGRDFVIDARYAEGHSARLPALATELVRSKVDIIASGGATASLAAKNATQTVPIVMIGAGDPVGVGLVASLSRPGGNVTGVAWDVGQDSFSKSLEILKEALPKIRHLAVLSNPDNPGQASASGKIKNAGALLGLRVQFFEARNPDHFERTFASLSKERAEALLILTDTVFIGQRQRLAELATTHRIPSMMGIREYVEAGGLISYGPNVPAAFQRAAYFVDRILTGTKPAELPVEQPTKFELIINQKTAKAFGIEIPGAMLLRADHIIE